MKVCVLSNSHAAALKTGHDQLSESEKQSLDVTFFAARHRGLANTEARNGVLTSTLPDVAAELRFTSGGQDVVDPGQYDVLVIHALGLAYDYSQFDPVFRSQQYLSRVFLSKLSKSIALQLFGKLRTLTNNLMVLSHQPYVAEADAHVRHRVERSPHSGVPFHEVMPPLLQRLEGPVGWLAQPEETITQSVFTSQVYSEGSIRLAISESSQGKRHGEDDHVHMNASYGLAFWRNFLRHHAG